MEQFLTEYYMINSFLILDIGTLPTKENLM